MLCGPPRYITASAAIYLMQRSPFLSPQLISHKRKIGDTVTMLDGKTCNIAPPLALGGIRIDALTLNDLLGLLGHAVKTRERLIFLNHNLHSLYLYETREDFREAYALASYVYVDGIPVIWLGRISGLSITSIHRITLLDSFEAILSEAIQRRWRIFYLGSTKGVNDQAISILRKKFPSLNINGHYGFFDKDGPENEEVIAKIVDYHTDILFIGMGMPNQERWLVENQSRLHVSSILTSGGTLDYVVGDAYKPPPWAGPIGLYGVMRLGADPRRLWRRYLYEPLILVRHMGFRLIRQRLQTTGLNRDIGAKQSPVSPAATSDL
jgi:N-acetylglucosaminyldiphosphoundecaprenol N-acetyl-beta-D-mannosaminyltransferase